METVACNLCGSTRSTPVYEMPDRRYPSDERFTVVECDQCGLGFVNPRPAFGDMPKYYPPRYYQEEFANDYKRHLKRYAIEARYLREIESRTTRPALLDIGCANGDFPRFMMARGWTVEGVEVSASTEPIRDFRAYSQPFPEVPVDDPTYDAVTAWAVLEHVHDPMAYFRKAAQLLKPGGLFVFLVPNSASLASRHLFCEDVPRHLFFFTRVSVNRYLHEAGLRLEREDNRGNIFSTAPENWLLFLLREHALGKKLSWENLPPTRPDFIRTEGLRPGLKSSLQYAIKYPLRVVERPWWPVLEWVQTLRGTYPTSTFAARKL